MLWRAATPDYAEQLGDLVVAATSGSHLMTTADASRFLSFWSVDIGFDDRGTATAAVAVVPPPDAQHHRGYGAWWDRRADAKQHIPAMVQRTVELARRTPTSTLQLSMPTDDHDRIAGVTGCGFSVAFPIWTMTHDHKTWPSTAPRLPPPLVLRPWSEELTDPFIAAYRESYPDQRVVETHGPTTLRSIVAEEAFSATISTLAIAPDGLVVGFIFAFQDGDHIELGPVGTLPAWRGRGISTALLEHVMITCRDLPVEKIGLTVDGDSPTGAQRLYLRYGFAITEDLIAYHRVLAS